MSTAALGTTVAFTPAMREAWNAAQRLWGVHMHDPRMVRGAGLPTFAWFEFPPRVSIDLEAAELFGVDGELVSLFAHELGHHVLAPSTRLEDLKITHQMARAIAGAAPNRVDGADKLASMFNNIWTDMLINTRVVEFQRRTDPDPLGGLVRVEWILSRPDGPTAPIPELHPAAWVIKRAYEELWGLPYGTLCLPYAPVLPPRPQVDEEFDALYSLDPLMDATLLAQTVRSFGDDPIRGALRFGMLMTPYYLENNPSGGSATAGGATCGGSVGSPPPSASELDEILRDARLRETPKHPIEESSVQAQGEAQSAGMAASTDGDARDKGQGFGLAETIALYGSADADTVVEAWYAAEAREWVRPYSQPARSTITDTEMPGPLELWDLDDELERIDWGATFAAGPRVIPGVTTRLRTAFADEQLHARESIHLDLYIDSSGSMRRPRDESPAVLAGTILILSVLRGGGRVRVTSFSGAGQVAGNAHYTRDRSEAMAMLLTFYGGGTVFPLDLLDQRYSGPAPKEGERRHLVVLSDDGLQSMFGVGQEAYSFVAGRVRPLLDTATLVVMDTRRSIVGYAAQYDYDVEYLVSMMDAPAACSRLAHRIAEHGREPSRG